MKILVASKVGFIRHTLQRSLKQDGHRVTTTDTPQNTLELIRNDCQIDVVVADWAMSGVSPTDVIRAIRRVERMNDEGKTAAPYVFVLTNPAEMPEDDDEDHDAERGLVLAFGEVFVKPVNVQLLRDRVRAIAAANAPKTKSDVQGAAAEEKPASEGTPGVAAGAPVEAVSAPHVPDLSNLVEVPSVVSSACFD